MHIEGKTKIVAPLWEGADVGLVTTKDDITAGDGAKHDVMPGKAELATRTTCNVFEYLRTEGTPVAYIGRDGPTTFLTRICNMIPVEVVVRRIATGSYLKRHPNVVEGTIFEDPVIECFYKTTGRCIGNQPLPCDDPLMEWNQTDGRYDLYLPNKPSADGFIDWLDLSDADAEMLKRQLDVCTVIATDINEYLCDAWLMLDGTLYDFKLEFGTLPNGSVLLADVVDCDSWRVTWNGIQLSKQGYRDGDDLSRVFGVYRLAASLTDQLV
ncbi:MAG: phosphoribosylaminoimidazolesuccinocarboxamide synthase [Minisyncoccia bacterium]